MIFDYAIFNGELLPVDKVQISLFTRSLYYGYGVFEFVKIDQGQPFYLEEHIRRLFKSAMMLDLKLKVDADTLMAWFQKLIEIDPQVTCNIRILALGEIDANPVVAMKPEPLRIYPKSFYQDGATAILCEGARVVPTCKSLNYVVNYMARREAIRAGALEALLHHNGYLVEGAFSNFFIVQQGQLITSPESEVLSGITRNLVIQIMQETEYPVIETQILLDLSQYEECFITTTSMHVMPITQIDGQLVGDGQVGTITKMAMSQFETHYQEVMAKNIGENK
ncbi:aminotransferase class IV [Anaerolineales bacterium HSG24]|nr:aminotransferase class IV [Anaerolineales bacterium HSG24]